ncbi:c-type cytochrome [Falsiroseomonas sp. HC035]|uniref:c-type cytochrome n=1 Tax=Falsiroseomonas sp. HC035 TaxID=3390999 RepID=UPI003D3215AB
MIKSYRLALVLGAVVMSSPAVASADLARSKNCIACHHAERRMIGPAYTLIAARYANDSAAVGALAERVITGGSGNWGQMPMPPQSSLSREEAETLVRWILSHR